jgi:4-amino-4-deoxychorismate lyase
MSRVLVDGVVSTVVPADDRGLMYGDGVFRTLRVLDSAPLWWDEQLRKLADDCKQLGFSVPDTAEWQADWAQIAPDAKQGVLKLWVTRGSGPRGYAPPLCPQIRRGMRFDPLFIEPVLTPLHMRVCSLKLGWQPRLAGIKHLNRLENVLARAEWTDADIQEGVLLDTADRVIAGVMSNLFIWRQNQLLTPRLDQCGVAGVARARLMRLARAQGIDVMEANLTLPAVFAAEEVMMTNSLWGVRRVERLDSQYWPAAVISPRLEVLLHA